MWTTHSFIVVRIFREAIVNLQIIARARSSVALLGVDAVDFELNMVSFGRCDLPDARLINWVFSWIVRALNNT